jgi:deferrochelatase/peroxidase EfeB
MSGAIPPSKASPDAVDAPSRRHLIVGLGAAGGTVVLSAVPGPATGSECPGEEASDPAWESQSFYGPHQAGVVTPQPAAGLIAAFDVLADNRDDLERLLRTLTARIAFLTKGGDVPVLDQRLPPAESGLLGPRIFPDNLTITVAIGASLFDARFGLATRRPRHLVAMEQFANDALDATLCHGDVLLQFCANTAETNIHALRDLIKNLPDLAALRWKIDGFLPPRTVRRLGKDTVRNLLGFKDGTANLDARDAALMDRMVWVQPETDEPAWAAGGTYQVVRIIRNLVERWDRTPLGEQQAIIGRHKASGAPLGLKDEHDSPDYTGDPRGERIPLDAHIRRANPRTKESESSRILRRGYNYARGVTASGQLDMGLLFVCFQANLSAQFLTVQRRLDGEPLEEYIKAIGGGYFFVLPGVSDANGFLGQALVAT